MTIAFVDILGEEPSREVASWIAVGRGVFSKSGSGFARFCEQLFAPGRAITWVKKALQQRSE
jgi:hypothetical protein